MSPRPRSTSVDITRYYIVALLIVGTLAAGSHLLQQTAIENQQGIGAVINLSGRQRMLSQRISSLAAQYRLGDPSAKPALIAATNAFEANHNTLSQTYLPAGATTHDATLHQAYFQGEHALDAEVRTYIAAARQVATLQPNDPAMAPLLTTLFTNSRTQLLTDLDHVVALHQEESESRIHDLRRLQRSILLIMIVTLILEAFLIFRPMVRRIVYYNAEILQLATTDSLTGTLNRREFFARSRVLRDQYAESGEPLSVLMLDIDNFKRINDTFGHAAGDIALTTFCSAIRTHLRSDDIFGRLGGEEFAILSPNTPLHAAIHLAERVREEISELTLPVGDTPLRFTVSIGVAELDPTDADLDDTFASADERLYEAKRSGRNRVIA
jgi:diguanylate cyclase (GGDEF)-like protein